MTAGEMLTLVLRVTGAVAFLDSTLGISVYAQVVSITIAATTMPNARR